MEEGVDGRITKGLDLDALTSAIRDLATDAEGRRRMGVASRTRVAERDWTRAARLFWEGSEE